LLGALTGIQHDVAGDVYARGDSQLVLQNFVYDGTGPDAFIIAGTKGAGPSGENADVVLSVPFQGQHFNYEDKRIPILKRFRGETVVLTMPPGVSVSQLRWISIWCRKFKMNFGDLIL